MEPPQLALIVSICATIELFLIASYEGTFAVLSRSTLEKMHENGIERARLMLRIYEPRHRVHLLTRIGQALGAIGLILGFFSFFSSLFQASDSSSFYAFLSTAITSGGILLGTSIPRRLRFEEDGEETHIPAIALAFVPLHASLISLTALIERLAAGRDSPAEAKAEKEEELRNLVEAESETGVIEEGEKEMIEGVFGFHDAIVREVMVPRVDIRAVEQGMSLAALVHTIEETGHSRVPLYNESLDRIRGIVYAKDLLRFLFKEPVLEAKLETLVVPQEGSPESAPLELHPPFYVPETKKIDELLRELRAARTRLAIVLDEYGGTAGLVTTEDLVEEIVGELQDEYDDEEELFHWLDSKDVLIVNPRINIDDLNELLEADLPSEGFETLAGFIYDHLGHVPREGQILQAHNLEIKILEVEEQRISQVRIERGLMLQKEEKARADA